MFVTFIIGAGIFIISFLLSLPVTLGTIFKKVGATSFGVFQTLFLLAFPCFLLIMELGMLHNAPDAWGAAYIFIVMNILFLPLQYFLVINSAVFTKNSIYRLTKFLVWKRHGYDEVIGYVMKKSSEIIHTRGGPTAVVTFDVEIYFRDNQYAAFSTKDQNNRKVTHIKQLLEEHHCHRNGRPKRKSRLPSRL